MVKVFSAATAGKAGSAIAAADAIRKERRVVCMIFLPELSNFFADTRDRSYARTNPIRL